MFEFCPNDYGKAVAELLPPERLPDLGPGTPNVAALPALKRLTDQRMFGENHLSHRGMAAACRAGLWLYHDYLDESHRISQTLEDANGSYWHALMHRREPDTDNAKYWFRRVGDHAVFPQLYQRTLELSVAESTTDADRQDVAALLSGGAWNPVAFVDLCENIRTRDAARQLLCRRIQLYEWQLLFDCCFRLASGQE